MNSPTDLPRAIFLALAGALPLSLLAIHHDLGHTGDLGFFHEWYVAFRGSSAFYRDGPGLNYPIVGVLLVCGPARIAEALLDRTLDLASFVLVLKSTLVLGEVALVLSAERLARALEVQRPRASALLVFALPCTWAGGAWFGQIDVWGTALLLASAAALVVYHRDGRRRWLAVGLALLMLALLTKQLTWFSLPALALLAVAGVRRHADHAAVALAMPALLFVADPFLVLPDGFRSHVAFVLLHGSRHGELAVASGAGLWSLFVPGGTLASDVRLFDISSFAWGWVLFALAMAFALVRTRNTPRSFVALAGVAQLAMATLLTGVHERYLAHAIPLLLLAEPRAGDTSRAGRRLGLAIAVLSGVFVLSTLSPHAFVGPLFLFARPEPLALASLAWLVAWLAPRADPSSAPAADEARPGGVPRPW